MGTWRYVVSLDKEADHDDLKWEIRELYPTVDGRFGYTANAVRPFGNTYDELIRDLEHMHQDSTLEVLDRRATEPRLVAIDQILMEISPDAESPSLPAQWDVPRALREPIDGRPRIVCICGSTRFRDEMADANRRLTLAGTVVLAPAVFQHSGDTITEAQKARLDELHLKKIDLADAVFVVDPGGYIGESTSREIAYARSTGKPVFRLSVVRDRYTERR